MRLNISYFHTMIMCLLWVAENYSFPTIGQLFFENPAKSTHLGIYFTLAPGSLFTRVFVKDKLVFRIWINPQFSLKGTRLLVTLILCNTRHKMIQRYLHFAFV